MGRPAWMDEAVERATIAAVLTAMGATEHHRRWSPCPVCGEATIGRDDRRGPLRIWRKGSATGWACVRGSCGASEDVIATIARAAGQADRARDWSAVRAFAAARGWCSAAEGWTVPPGVRMLAPVPPPPPRVYASVDAARRVWDRALRVTEDAAALDWIRRRVEAEGDGDAEAVIGRIVATDLARVLPIGAEVPTWARCQGRDWSAEGMVDGVPVGWRLIMRAFGPDGKVAGLRARSLWTGQRVEGHRKELAPVGGTPPGTVYACGMGRALLRGDVRAPGGYLKSRRWGGLVIVREGGPDWLLTAASPAVIDGDAIAVLGVWAGAWVGEPGAKLAARLAEVGAAALIATDPDEAGDRYAAQIGSALDLAGVVHSRGGR